MATWIALLRVVNVGGTGKLSMTDLKALCADAGFQNVATYIASGNVVFDSTLNEAGIRQALETRLLDHSGKPVGVAVRSRSEMAAVLANNPFPDFKASYTTAIFLDTQPPVDFASGLKGHADELLRSGTREIYVTYPSGMGQSRLTIPAARLGTARNMNTIAKLAMMAEQSEQRA